MKTSTSIASAFSLYVRLGWDWVRETMHMFMWPRSALRWHNTTLLLHQSFNSTSVCVFLCLQWLLLFRQSAIVPALWPARKMEKSYTHTHTHTKKRNMMIEGMWSYVERTHSFFMIFSINKLKEKDKGVNDLWGWGRRGRWENTSRHVIN